MHRRMMRSAPAIALLFLLAGCAPSTPGPHPQPPVGGDVSVSFETGARSIWWIGVGPRRGDATGCLADPSIEQALQSADLPSSALGIDLFADAGRADAQRIADCLAGAYSSADITVVAPEGESVD